MALRKTVTLAAAIFCVMAAFGVYMLLGDDNNDGAIAYGTVNVKDSHLSFEIAGRISSINVKEGQEVKKGQIIASLDTKDLLHQRAVQKASCQMHEQVYLSLKNGNRKEDIDKTRYTLKALQSELDLSSKTLVRYKKLLDKKAISYQEYDSALYNNKVLTDRVGEAKAALALMLAGPRQESILEKKAALDSCLASLDYLDYKINEQSLIKAPFDGAIRAQYSQLSDMAGPNVVSFAFCNISNKEISVYLSNRFLNEHRVKNGDKVRVFTDDTYTDYVEGLVSFISETAMFTPKSVATVDLRPDLVYECKITVEDTQHLLRFGSDVTVDFTQETKR